jgi:dUTP pyrophosphatase
MQQIKVVLLNEFAHCPTRHNQTDAGLDLYASHEGGIPPNSTRIIRTSVAVEVPNGYVGKVEDRSSMASKGLRTGGGVIDSGYTGEVKVIIHNLTNFRYTIRKGDKIAQLLLYRVETPGVFIVEALEDSERGLMGFGSSGA